MKKKKGVLIANIGTPAQPERQAVKKYLSQFLGDARVIDKPRWQWLPVLHGIILNVRPQKSAKLYQSIWREEGSPLFIYTQQQAELLQKALPDYVVHFGMAYSEPTISQSLAELAAHGVEEVTIIPLYPQYSTTTTASINDAVFKHYLKQENMPHLRFIREFASQPAYIELLAQQVEETLAKIEEPDMLVISYHGIPESYVTKGDPYDQECQATTTRLKARLKTTVPIKVAYQSKFGPDAWLTPALDQTLMALPQQGVKKVAVISPGFVSDCLETLEEIEEENRGYFIGNGGTEFTYIHPFNGDPRFIALLADLVLAP